MAFWQKRERYISTGQYRIDRERVYKFFYGIDGRKRFDPPVFKSVREARHTKYFKTWLKMSHYMSGVDSVTDFKKMIADEKKRIRRKNGRPSAFEKRMLNANYKRFLKPLEVSVLEEH